MKKKINDKYLNRLLFVLTVFIILFNTIIPKRKVKSLETLKISKEDIELNNGIQQGKYEPFNYDIK
jgi:hypothetical protein